MLIACRLWRAPHLASLARCHAASIEGAPMSEEAGGGIRSWRHQQASETKAETVTFSEEATALQQTLPIREQTDRRGVVRGASVQGAHWPETLGLIIL